MAKARQFNPTHAGTSEQEWNALLSHSEKWTPQPGRLVVVAPHPDDEVLGAGGLVSSWAVAGHPVTVVSVTDGEAADTSRVELKVVRQAELRQALRKLSLLHVDIHRLGIPDGQVKEHMNRLHGALLELVEPGSTLIAPYEQDGHPDHEAVGRACLEVARFKGVVIARYPIWAWHHASPSKLRFLRWGLFPLATCAQRAKRHAVQCFKSQLSPSRGEPIVPAHVLSYFERPYEAFLL